MAGSSQPEHTPRDPTAGPPPPAELGAELLDDFYAECDELLTALREGLTQLEHTPAAAPDPEIVAGLFRCTHSMKGNAAIVGLRSAEEVAHAMEDIFRAVGKRETALSAPGLEVLLAATQRLEKIVVAQRLKQPLPDNRALLTKLRKLRPAPPEAAAPPPAATDPAHASPPPAAKPDPLAAARAKNLSIFRVSFVPAKALDERGVNVKSVRERLGQLGEILSATPSVREQGQVVFEFLIGLRTPPTDLAAWSADGLSFVPADEASPADAPSLASGSASMSAPEPDSADPASGVPDLTGALSLAPSHLVRVELARLDELMRITGEMVIQRSRLEDRLKQHGEAYASLKDVNLGLSRSLRDLRAAITRVRMVPIGEIFARMPFVVRDLMSGADKTVRVVLEGKHTEVDKYLVERLKEPLLHLVRNAFAHGLESTAERTAAGKPAEATITLRAKSAGETVLIQIRDDGRGIDAAAVFARAARLGLKLPASPDASGLLEILCTPGFSTREEADRAAGRGMGMAVVARVVRELGGLLTLDTWLGRGTEFTLRLPLTLSIADAIIVTVGAETCAVPQSAIEEILEVPATAVRTIKQTEVMPYRDGLLPLVRLRALFRASAVRPATLYVLAVATERGVTGLVVDRVVSQREVVIRPLADPLLRVPGIAGATELGDGRPILILDPNAITQGVVRPATTVASRAGREPAEISAS